ncbi:single-stranded-DNA-specific exonuclease RecJ [Streptococcus chenjunshii]|uniref:Single-stranded-DNA-specific exonuclease RecJ n=1 Tax=Streptococcus chenjunshii TaxID=2173853 RepID=A0A372KKG0_9STRE|nr:single-stranded-DNA-specific exonuclease RecJ [Streptococcus chenjunshii]AXQ78400.1 single-stranded-DNA-specific exonuclease RecJ [Streptococcus chenjunshii]RFU50531.1 single-stranded-DNA-specific exonuclease RecJ [Streptococcus chenjunshii]RFU52791.1 single-stranded-DNA-specific exonuclease RecJ [Streptococcus chenjunshii]
MISAKYNWKIADQKPESDFLKLLQKEKLTEEAGTILYRRGIDTAEKLHAFLQADLSDLHDPYLLYDMEKSVSRIRQAIENGERILIYGDYDADGMTAASVMKEALEMLGAEARVYLPNRFTDGYGPNKSVYKYFAEQEDISLIITVDNGVAGHEALAYAHKQGLDVIVTDHHSIPDELPEAYAIVHPQHPESTYPFKDLAGCGVAFKLACALLESVPAELLDLVAIGTIADMVSLTDENRIMVKLGLQVLKTGERFGLQELLRLSQADADQLNEETVAFKLAPQLNALGRLADPNPAVDLLTGFDEEEAQELALMIYDKNEERKQIVETIFQEAMTLVDTSQPVQILAKSGWHPGVLGIVAGRILEELNQPVIVLNIEDGIAKGSARSVAALDIFQALTNRRDLFIAFGGHSGAAGMTLAAEKLPDLSQALSDYIAAEAINLSQKRVLQMDANLDLSSLSLDTVASLTRLAPFGMDNKKPVFHLTDFIVKQARTMGQQGKHLKLKIAQGEAVFDLVAFNRGSQLQEFQQAQNLELAVTLSVNRWNGQTALQLMLEDARVEGVQLLDIRSNKSSLPADVPVLTADSQSKEVVLLNVPENPEDLKALFAGKVFDVIYFKNRIEHQYYLTGYGTREQFAKLYRTIYQFPEFDVRYKLKELASYLKIPDILLVKMIQIFDELDFVRIADGVMTVNKKAEKREIADSRIYQDLKQLVKFQELMALGTPQEIYDFLKGNE